MQSAYTEIFKICLKDVGLQGDAWEKFKVICSNKCKEKSCKNDCGCNHCEKTCNYPLAEELMVLIERINSFVFNKGSDYGQYLGFGYPLTCLDKTKKLLVYKDILVKMHNYLLWEEKGLKVSHPVCPNEYPKLKSEIISIIGNQSIEHYNESRDESNLDSWLLLNPRCVSFDRWKRVFYNMCFVPEIKVTPVLEKECKFIYNIVSKEKKECSVIYKSISDIDKKCEVNYVSRIKESQCKIDYDTKIKESKCNINYNTYLKALKCGFTAKSIIDIYSCGVKIKSDKQKKDCVVLTLSTGEEISCNKSNYLFIIKNIEQCVLT